MGVIQNAAALGTTPLRRDALAIAEAGYEAIRTETVIGRAVRRTGGSLTAAGKHVSLDRVRRLVVLTIGKCAYAAGRALEETLGDRITAGIAFDVLRNNDERFA